MASATYQKLRRLAPRIVRVIARRKSQFKVIGTYEATVVPHAQVYIAAYDKARGYKSTWQRETQESVSAVQSLVNSIRSWLPLAARDIPGFDSRDYADNPNVPDDVIADAVRLCDVLSDYSESINTPLAYLADCVGELEALAKAAEKESSEAEAADKTYQDLLAEVRKTGDELDRDLQAFRRTLATTVGRSDKDYQKLRANRAQVADEDDDSASPPATQPVTPAPLGSNNPVV